MCSGEKDETSRAVRSLRRPAIVDFDQADASAVVQSREQRGVKARRQCRGYGRLEVIARRQTRCTQGGNQRQARSQPYFNQLRGAPESQYENVHAPIHEIDEWIQQETRERRARAGPLFHVLQLLPDSSDLAGDTAMEAGVSDHVWSFEEVINLLDKGI
jgi:hypothetical protein